MKNEIKERIDITVAIIILGIIVLIYMGVQGNFNRQFEEIDYFCHNKEGIKIFKNEEIDCTAWKVGDFETWNQINQLMI